ncbi:MAG: hypothetical protein ABW148_00225 [Sedimenticola sp.]
MRAQNWHHAIRQAQADQGRPKQARLILLDGEGHDFESNIKNGGMGDHVFMYITRHS